MYRRALNVTHGLNQFSPRQIVALLRGAWLEPTPGVIWQENTGVTPTTTGGQTIGKISDQSGGGNNATQSTAANRPLLGRRYNLFVASENMTSSGWLNQGSPTITATTYKANAQFDVRKQNLTLVPGTRYTLSYTARLISGDPRILLYHGQGGIDYTDITITGTSARYSAEFTATNTTVAVGIGFRYTTNFPTVEVSQFDLRLSSDVGKDPAYQRITTATDYDYGQYPAAVHDATDSLVVSLPAINVRRNLLTYSEQFDNGVWTKQRITVQQDSALSPDNTGTADKIVATTENGTHIVGTQAFTVTSGLSYTFSVSVKAAGISSVVFRTVLNTSATFPDTGILVNLTTGAVTTDTGSPLNAFAIAQNNGYWRIGFSCVATGSGSTQQFLVYLNSRAAFTGDGTSGVFIWGAQLELGSVATGYQKITDWTSEAYASSGSVYFSTPVGMSALHNQSMGTSFTLPALSTDIYSWIVVPQRLSTVLENRLARYMERRAGIAGPDAFEQEDYGPRLETNGDFTNGTTGWTATNATIALSSGQLQVTSTGAFSQSFASQVISGLTVGKTYIFTATAKRTAATNAYATIYDWTGTLGPFRGNAAISTGAVVTGSYVFIAATTSAAIYLQMLSTSEAGQTALFDNISVRELKDGMTGQLFADDGDLLLRA